jgi:DNA-binding NarL/FixJ family response regulator
MTETSTVLIVDDNEEVRDALRLIFELDGFEVVAEADNGLEATTKALAYGPEIVVLDYMMPMRDGEGTARILRAMMPEVRILAFSAILDHKPYWADGFLTKNRLAEVVKVARGLFQPV